MAQLDLHVRVARPDDAVVLCETLSEGFESYRAWAPASWDPPSTTAATVHRLAEALDRADVWCLLASHDDTVVGHVAISSTTYEEPTPAPYDTTYLWQLFVRRAWQGSGVATSLMDAALEEARDRGFKRLLLWTPIGAKQARRFYERQGWLPTGRSHEHSSFGLPTIEYQRATAI